MHALIQYRVNPNYRECRVSLEGHQLNMKQLLLVLAIGLTTLPLRATLVENRPDVLFIAVDDMNDWISLLDPKSPIKTPNLKRLASRGMLFTRAYCISPACNPSRAATLTGLRPSTTGIYGNASDWRGARPNRKTTPTSQKQK